MAPLDNTDELYQQIIRYTSGGFSGVTSKVSTAQTSIQSSSQSRAQPVMSSAPTQKKSWSEVAANVEWAPLFKAPDDALEAGASESPAKQYWDWFCYSFGSRLEAALIAGKQSLAVFKDENLEGTVSTCERMGMKLCDRDASHINELLKSNRPQQVLAQIITKANPQADKSLLGGVSVAKQDSKKGKQSPKSKPASEPKSKAKAEPKAKGKDAPGKDTKTDAAVPNGPTPDDRKAKLKKVIKEGGKRGVEIEGAADMGGLKYFCTSMDEPEGDLELLEESMKAMNAKSDPTEEERKGGSGHIGKMLFSAGAEQLGIVAYLPDANKSELNCGDWIEHVTKMIGGKVVKKTHTSAQAVVKTDSDKGVFPLKVKEPGIMEAIQFLKGKGLFPDADSDDDDMVFGDDDFPS